MNDRAGRYARLRYTATGALAALAVAGAIAGAVALAATPHTKTPVAASPGSKAPTAKTPTSPLPTKTHAPQPGSDRPFLNAIAQLVSDGTISPAQGQALDSEIVTGQVDTQTLAPSGFTQTQLQAVQQTLANTKRSLAPGAGPRPPK